MRVAAEQENRGSGGGIRARIGHQVWAVPRCRRSQARCFFGSRLSECSNYVFGRCPWQDSNLRSRLRRPLLHDAPTWRNALFPSGWGAYGERQGANPAVIGEPHPRVSAEGARTVVTTVGRVLILG